MLLLLALPYAALVGGGLPDARACATSQRSSGRSRSPSSPASPSSCCWPTAGSSSPSTAGAALLAWIALARPGAAPADRLGAVPGHGARLHPRRRGAAADFFVASAHPGDGAPSLVLVALAAVALGACAGTAPPDGPFSGAEITLARALGGPLLAAVVPGRVAGAGVALYALSLGILELAELAPAPAVARTSSAGTPASAPPGALIGLCLLDRSASSGAPAAIRLAGFALYGIAHRQALPLRPRRTRARSAARSPSWPSAILLLASGFFYQRLSERMAEPRAPAPA